MEGKEDFDKRYEDGACRIKKYRIRQVYDSV